MFISPAPRREHPFRRKEWWACVERMLAHKRCGLLIGVYLHLKGGSLEIDLDSFGISGSEIEASGPCPFDEYGITARRQIKRGVNRRGGFDDHVDFLAAQIQGGLDARRP